MTKLPVALGSDSDLQDDRSSNTLFLGVTLTFAALTWIGIVFVWCIVRRKNRRTSEQAGEDSPKVSATELRYRSIEKWLVTKKVLNHDDLCEMAVAQNINQSACSHQPSDTEECGSTFSGESNGHDTRDCPICMDVLSTDEIVSWSPNPSCNHVFHHRCIKEWLVKHTDCPFCRSCFLPIDVGAKGRLSEKIDSLSANEIARREELSQTCYYCIRHGIVSINSSDTDHNFCEELQKRASQVVDVEELEKCRAVPESSPASNLSIPTGSDAFDADTGDQSGGQAETSDEEAGEQITN